MALAGAILLLVGVERLLNASLLQGTIYAGFRLATGLTCALIGSLLVGAAAIVNLHSRWLRGPQRAPGEVTEVTHGSSPGGADR
jgi:hypothetical protein